MESLTKQRRYVDGLEARLKNRRVTALLQHDGSIQFVFRRLSEGEVMNQTIRLSVEAVASMYGMALRLEARNPHLFAHQDAASTEPRGEERQETA